MTTHRLQSQYQVPNSLTSGHNNVSSQFYVYEIHIEYTHSNGIYTSVAHTTAAAVASQKCTRITLKIYNTYKCIVCRVSICIYKRYRNSCNAYNFKRRYTICISHHQQPPSWLTSRLFKGRGLLGFSDCEFYIISEVISKYGKQNCMVRCWCGVLRRGRKKKDGNVMWYRLTVCWQNSCMYVISYTCIYKVKKIDWRRTTCLCMEN